MRAPVARRLLASVLTTALLLQAVPASAIGLLEAYEAAVQNDPTYRAAVHENEAGQQNMALGRAYLLPNLSLSYSTSNNRSDITEPNFLGQVSTTHPDYRSRSASLSLRQPLLNLEAIARYRQSLAQTGYSDAQFAGRKRDLIIRLVSAYADAQYAEYQAALVQAQRDAYAEQMRVNERMFQKGEGTRTDMLETKAKLDLAEAQLIEARDNLTVMRNALAAIVGREITDLDGLADDFRVKPMQPASFDDWRAIALQNNAEVAAQKQAVEAARQEINKNRAGHVPRIDFVAGLSKGQSESLTTRDQESKVRSVGFQLSMPIFSGGATEAATVQAVANHEKAKSELEAKSKQVLVELRKQYSQALSSATKIDALMKSVQSANLLVEATRQSIKGGVRINLDLLNAQQQLYAAKRDLAQARYNYLLSYLRLRNVAGTLTADDLHAIAGYFVRGGGTASPASAPAAMTQVSMPVGPGTGAAAAASAARLQAQAPVAPAPDADAARNEVLELVNAWAQAWSARDVDAYLGFYADGFRPDNGRTHAAWAEERRSRIEAKSTIAVRTEAPEVTLNGDTATVKFRQIYKSDRLADETDKTLVLVKQGGAWKIKQETTAG
ncbi:MAG TPA: TolC family outer membrane protein [Paucimonas sp.]|nr:TolC family outer membrane protein [Paucimonas sp.]